MSSNNKKAPLLLVPKTTNHSSSPSPSNQHRGRRIDKSTGGFETTPQDSCIGRFCEDLTGTCRRRPNFRAIDGVNNVDKIIDIPASFSPSGIVNLGLKICFFGVGVYTFFLGYVQDQRPFYFAYLTHWGLVVSLVYQVLSIYNSVFPLPQPPIGQTQVNWRTKVTWSIFTIAVHSEVLLTTLYWAVLFDGTMELVSILSHGGVMLLLLLDGFGVNTIPFRLRHWFELALPFMLLYIIWSVLHSDLVFGIGNPDNQDEDIETTDDLIYNILDWANEPEQTALLATIIVLVLSPIVHLVLWGISSCRRRYVVEIEMQCEATDVVCNHGRSGNSTSKNKNKNNNYSRMRGSGMSTNV